MTREEAIIEAGIEYSIQNSPYCIGGDNFYEKARELNRNKSFEAGVIWADKNPKSPWISVKDDLPCNHEDMIALAGNLSKHTCSVLVRFDHGGINFAYMYCNGYKQDWHWSERGIITHWMQIPKLEEE